MSRFESLIERQIRLAQERGEFDNLPGLGKPLPDRGEQDDELWWVKDYLRREGLSTEALLPPPLLRHYFGEVVVSRRILTTTSGK